MIELSTLRALPVFGEYEDRELAVLLGSSTEREYASQETLCDEGQRGRSCFLVVSGKVEVQRSTPEGPLNMGRFGPGMFVGAMALVDGGVRSTTARAVTPVGALEFARDVFEALLRARSPLALRFQRQLAVAGIRKLRGATAQLLELLSTEARDTPSDRPPTGHTRDVLRYIQTSVDEWGNALENVAVKPAERSQQGPRASSRPPRRGA